MAELLFGGRTVEENLARAVTNGSLIMQPGGRFSLPPQMATDYQLLVKSIEKKGCRFLNAFVFQRAYVRTSVPYGCRNCYKVKIVPPHLCGLIALRSILENVPYSSKCGFNGFNNPYTSEIYSGHLYLEGLVAAQAAFRDLREQVNAHPELGATVPMKIKRGCSNMEAACGPPDRWTFHNEMQTLEIRLKARYKSVSSLVGDYVFRRKMAMIQWLQIAYNLKDETYLAFTNGKPLYQHPVS